MESYLIKFGATPYRVPPADKKVLSFTKFLKFSFTGNTKPAMPAKIFLFAGCYIGGRPHPSTGGLIFNRCTTHFSRGNNVQSVTSLKNAKPEKTRILKKLIMQALDLYSHQIRLLGRALRPLHVKHVKTDSEYPISILSAKPTKRKKRR